MRATCESETGSHVPSYVMSKRIPEAKWSKAITAGNKAGHDGDENIFESGFRSDETLMVKNIWPVLSPGSQIK